MSKERRDPRVGTLAASGPGGRKPRNESNRLARLGLRLLGEGRGQFVANKCGTLSCDVMGAEFFQRLLIYTNLKPHAVIVENSSSGNVFNLLALAS